MFQTRQCNLSLELFTQSTKCYQKVIKIEITEKKTEIIIYVVCQAWESEEVDICKSFCSTILKCHRIHLLGKTCTKTLLNNLLDKL